MPREEKWRTRNVWAGRKKKQKERKKRKEKVVEG